MKKSSESLLSVSDLRVEEDGNIILQGISFKQQQFKKLVIAGETGSGKSTLLQCIAGLVQPAAGEVLFEKMKVQGPHEVLVAGHPGIAYLSQQYELPRFLRVEQVMKYANLLPGEEAASLFELCRISHLLKRKTNQLSGGERQRIALAKLLIASPKLLLLDEPYSNLDVAHKKVLKAVIQDIGEKLDITCILISHDPADTLSWADEIIILKEGQMVQKGKPEEIYRKPVNEYAAALFGNYNIIPATLANKLFNHNCLKSAKKSMIVRPEDLCLTKKGIEALKGTVRKVTFYGSYYEVEVQLKDVVVTAKTAACRWKVMDKVYVAMSLDNANYL